MADVFVSYKREDKDRAVVVANQLAARGVRVWWDVDLLPGDRFADEIARVIDQAKLAIVLWSQRSATSDWVRAEARLALEQKKLLPARLDNVEIPLPFNDLHTLDLRGWKGEESGAQLAQLIDAVLQRLNATATAELPASEAQEYLHDHDQEARFWRAINGRTPPSKEELQIYLKRFPNGLFNELAELKLNQPRTPRFRMRPVAFAGAVAAILAPLAIIFALIKDYPNVQRVLRGDTPTSDVAESSLSPPAAEMAESEGQYLQAAVSDVDSALLENAGDALLNMARPTAMPPIYIEDIFRSPDAPVSLKTKYEARNRILERLGSLLPDGTSIPLFSAIGFSGLTDALVRRAAEALVEDYRQRLPLELREVEDLPAPPLIKISGHGNRYTKSTWQDPNEVTCKDERLFLQYHRTYVELLLLYRAVFLRSLGADGGFVEQVGLGYEYPAWLSPFQDPEFDLPQPTYATTMGLDLFLASGTLDALAPILIEEAGKLNPAWQRRLAMFAAYTLDYRDVYESLIDDVGELQFRRTYLSTQVDDVPNPFGCSQTSGQRFFFEFNFLCSRWGDTCSPVHFFELGRDENTPVSNVWPGLHQGMVLMWYRRDVAATDDRLAEFLEKVVGLSSRRALDFEEIDKALEAGASEVGGG